MQATKYHNEFDRLVHCARLVLGASSFLLVSCNKFETRDTTLGFERVGGMIKRENLITFFRSSDRCLSQLTLIRASNSPHWMAFEKACRNT